MTLQRESESTMEDVCMILSLQFLPFLPSTQALTRRNVMKLSVVWSWFLSVNNFLVLIKQLPVQRPCLDVAVGELSQQPRQMN